MFTHLFVRGLVRACLPFIDDTIVDLLKRSLLMIFLDLTITNKEITMHVVLRIISLRFFLDFEAFDSKSRRKQLLNTFKSVEH